MTCISRPILAALVLACAGTGIYAADAPPLVDTLYLGTPPSESAHDVKADRSDTIKGGLGEPARRLLPRDPVGDYGGSISFHLKIDPDRQNYVTVKLWGGDAGDDLGRLLLLVEGKQLGVRHIGDVDILDIAGSEPRFPGRWVYKTLPLPAAMTTGKSSIDLQIRGLGRIWGYGTTWEQFQKPLDHPTRGVYAVYTHTTSGFTPPDTELQGTPVTDAPLRTEPGPEILEKVKTRVNNSLAKLLASTGPLKQVEMQLLAKAYHVSWTVAFHKAETVQRLVDGLDAIYLRYRETPRLAESDPDTPNADWFGLGICGDVIRLVANELTPYLDQPVKGGDGVRRRDAWTRMLVQCRDWHRQHRRMYTNQSMINDLYGIYLANRGIAVCTPREAMLEDAARRYLYESVGLQPWLGSEGPHGPMRPAGDQYMQLTAKGLTRELGYVGAYGEVIDWVTSIYEATRTAPGAEGDAKIKAQLIKIAEARANFRHPFVDSEGFRAMALETVVGWRDSHYPGDITYGQRTTWDAGPLESAASTLDSRLIAYGQQMLQDHQFFAAMENRLKEGGFRVTAGLLGTPLAYERVKAEPPSSTRLPMTPGQPDFVFSDEEDGVVAVKNGSDVLYASLYWRARYGINGLARVHHLTPTMERDATLREEVQFDDSGMKFIRPGRIVEEHSARHERSTTDVKQALDGEVQPIAKIPDGIDFKPGQESVYAGKGTFYILNYGDYRIAMNMTTNRTFQLQAPVCETIELVKRTPMEPGARIEVGPRTTVVLYRR